jgi:hypothetical protein
MKYTIAFAIIISLTLSSVSMAGDWDKDPHKMLSTLKPEQKYEELGLIVFFQGKETSVFGSVSNATVEEAVKTLEERGTKMGADMIIGVSIVPMTGFGDIGLIVYGTAIKFVKQ